MVGRIVSAVILSVAVIALVGAATVAAGGSGQSAAESSCKGVLNAYAHAADPALPALQAVADKHGCDVSGVERVAKPGNKPDKAEPNEPDEDANEPADNEQDTDAEDAQGAGPDVQAKCDRIAEKLATAQARPHGKSADAFARQAAHWSCPAS